MKQVLQSTIFMKFIPEELKFLVECKQKYSLSYSSVINIIFCKVTHDLNYDSDKFFSDYLQQGLF